MEINFGGLGNSGRNSDQHQLMDPVLASETDGSFKPLNTVPAFSFHLLISTLISIDGIVLAFIMPDDKRCEAYFIMLYLRVAFWFITFIFDHIVKKHHDNLRLNGYHEFHRDTAIHKAVPLQIVSLWNSVLLAVQALIHHLYGNAFWQHCLQGLLSPIFYVTAFTIVENIVLAVVHMSYIRKVRNFNKAAQPADALRGASNPSGSLGLVQPGGHSAELLEKQADLIAYLKDHNAKLAEKLHQMKLNARTVNISN